jgi:hypothetical protein
VGYLGLKYYVVILDSVAIKVLRCKLLGPYHWLLISGINGIKIELMGMCQVVH